MATHLRGRAYQAGAFLALIGGFLVVAPAPALADDPTVTINNISSANLKAGERATMTFQVENRNPGPPQEMVITVASTIDELRCEGNCNIRERIPAGQPRQYTVNLVAGSMEAGRSRSGRVEVRANVGDEGASAQRAVTVRGDERPPTVDEVNGRIRDQDGDPVGGAEVAMQDSQGHQYSTTSNSSGRYRFESSDRTPISPGSITVGAQKNGFTRQVRTTSAEAGKSVTVSLTMQSTAAPSPSATPSATPKASATPAEEASDEAAAEQPSAPAVKNTAAQDDDSGSLLFIILGGLLVAAGIGAIILVLMRRKEPDEDPDDVDGGVPAGGVVPPSHGRYGGVPDATRVAGALSGRPADATMVAGPAVPPSIADAPTMLQRAVPADDEFADPYGAPSAVPHAGYAPAAPGGWGTAAGAGAGAAAGAYGAQQYGGAPAPATTYGPAAGSPAPYGGGTGTYGAAAVPVTPPAQGDTGYAAPPASGGGYAGPPASGGYGGPAGGNPYARPPAPAGGYGRPAGDQRFDEPTGWYNQDAGDAGHRGTPPV
ncbi:MAG TPA: carboxypeptidase regulatory-like domain-containing protein, partial [Actinoplanes sp.]